MITRNLGKSGISISAVGLGCMGLSEFYGPPAQESEAINLLHRAVDLGITHFDTAELYGQGRNEQLLGKAFAGRWDQIVLATKFGPQRDPATGAFLGVDGSPANVRSSCEKSLRRLGTDRIDLYYLHRVDPSTPIEETVGEMAKLVEEGKIGAVGLSEASAETIKRANAVCSIAALQTEYSIFSRDIERDILPACLELNISLVAYSPLGRGMLTGRYSSASERPTSETDFRAQMQPRFQPGNIESNLKLVEAIKKIAAQKGCVAAQVALAWVLGQGDHVVAIPGTTKLTNLEVNLGALDCRLTDEDRGVLNNLADKVLGDRYDPDGMAGVNQ
ncbi:aldo/keto reductase [uncultured Desulfosarcina sp.]|uniref:aldo/keto reductase n=1 Tax=uncultured Desulfosarcina sp. TaxID=218289 RepID=UPI0029C73C9E|nr:aldo/keto reductase [uncultured Desulfosarcina sp.]